MYTHEYNSARPAGCPRRGIAALYGAQWLRLHTELEATMFPEGFLVSCHFSPSRNDSSALASPFSPLLGTYRGGRPRIAASVTLGLGVGLE